MAARKSPPPPSPGPAGDADDNVQIPAFFVDPLASLKPAPIDVDMFGKTWSLPAMSAAQWLEILWAEPFDPGAIFPGLFACGDQAIDALIEGTVTSDELFMVAMEVLTVASGLDWWFAMQLALVARHSWGSIGDGVLRSGIWADQHTLAAWLSVVLGVCVDRIDAKKVPKFILDLNTPPAGFEPELDEDAEGAAFLAAMRQSL